MPILLSLLALFFHSAIHAEVIDIELVAVDDPGNPPQELTFNDDFEPLPARLLGGVDYDFRIAKFEVTNEEYAAFLNAVDPDGTGYGNAATLLYGGQAENDPFLDNATGIFLKPANAKGARWEVRVVGAQNWARKPVAHVGWTMAARFVNWLHNGQPVLAATPGALRDDVTEDGAYDFSFPFPPRRDNARYWIPSADEWQKAAFYDPTRNGGAGGYWLFPTRSDGTEGLLASTDFDDKGVGLPTNGGDSANQRSPGGRPTDVGTNGHPSYYGTFDQAGNVEEWLDDLYLNNAEVALKRLLIGGSWSGNPNAIWQKRYGATEAFALPDQEPGPSSLIGFRVASRPAEEPVVAAAFVQVTDPGNAPITDNNEPALGAVPAPFAIGVHEVTNAQFADFLNKVYPDAIGVDPRVPFDFWDGTLQDLQVRLAIANAEQQQFRRGIVFDGAAPAGQRFQVLEYFSNKPVNYVSWFDAARYVNWLHNGSPTFPTMAAARASRVTESGAYALPDPAQDFIAGGWQQIVRQPGARYWLPSEDEWVKAAYYDPTLNAGAGGYWRFAVRSDGFFEGDFLNAGLQGSAADSIGRGRPAGPLPANAQGGLDDGGNSANIGGPLFWIVPNNVTTVGSNGRASDYGTYDQEGNLREWNDSLLAGDNNSSHRGRRGSYWAGGQSGRFGLILSQRSAQLNDMIVRDSLTGFRVATRASQSIEVFPEPVIPDKKFGDAPFDVGVPASTSRLPVVLTVKSGPARVDGNRVILTGAGTVVLAANQPGNDIFAPAPEEKTVSFTVRKGTQAIANFAAIAGKPFRRSPFTVRVPASNSRLRVVLSVKSGPARVAGNRVTLTGVGRVTLAANQRGNANYLPAAEKTVSFTVFDATAPTLRVTSPKRGKGTASRNRFNVKGRVSDDINPTRLEFRSKAPGSRKFTKPKSIVLRKTAKSKRWSLPLRLDRRGDWILQVRALDAASNASRWQAATIKRR